MNLYKISQEKNCGYDTYDSAVVCASSEEAARNMHPSSGQPVDWVKTAEKPMLYQSWCIRPEDVAVEFLGVADPSVKEGVVVASFNAG